MLEHQKEHFMRDFLQFLHCVASKSTFSYEFSYEHRNLLPENRCFLRGFRQFSTRLTKCYARHAICSLSPLDAALTMRFAKTRNMIRLKCGACHAKWQWSSPKCCACHDNWNATVCATRNCKKLSNQRGQWKLFYMKPTQALRCQHSLPFPRSSMAHVAQIPKVTSLAPANHAHVRAEHSAGSSAAAQCSNDTKQRGQRQQHRQVAATSHSASSNIPRHAPSQAASARQLTPLKLSGSTRHRDNKHTHTGTHTSCTHMSTNKHTGTHLRFKHSGSRACEFCLFSVTNLVH